MNYRSVILATVVTVVLLMGADQVSAEVSMDPFAVHFDTIFSKVDYGTCEPEYWGDTAWNPDDYNLRLCTPRGRRVGGVRGTSFCHLKIIDPVSGCMLWNCRLSGEGLITGDLDLIVSLPIGVELTTLEFDSLSAYQGWINYYHQDGFTLIRGETYNFEITEQVMGCPLQPPQERKKVTVTLTMPDCCGYYYAGYTGNTNCDELGKVNLSDVNRLIDYVYQNGPELCCHENGNVDGDAEGKVNAADITRLIDHIYLSKDPTEPCQ